MNSFRILIKKDLWILRNNILEIKDDPKRLIIYSLYIFWIGSLIFKSISSIKRGNLGKNPLNLNESYISAIYFSLITIILFYNIIKGMNKSSTFFSMGDVHMLFPSPISSNKILLYSMIRKTILNFFMYGLIVIAFLPTIANSVEIDLTYLPFLYLGFISFILTIEPLNFMLFTITSKYRNKVIVKILVYLSIVLFILYIMISALGKGNLLSNIIIALNNDYLNYIPIVGWSRSSFIIPIEGMTTYRLISTVSMFLFIIVCVSLSYIFAGDYYEDVIKTTEKKESKRRKKRGIDKQDNPLKFFTKKGKINVKITGKGSKALMWKNKVEYKRTDIHQYFSILSLMFLIMGIMTGYFTRNIENNIPIYIITSVLAYVIFIFSATMSRSNELSKPYIYLIPGTYISKILYLNSVDFIRMVINGGLFYIPFIFFSNISIINLIILWIFIVSFYSLNIISNFLVRIVFPNSLDQKTLFPIFFILQLILLIIPGFIIGMILLAILNNTIGIFMGFSVSNIILTIIVIFMSDSLFQKLEWRE